MTSEELKKRTKGFSIDVLKFLEKLPKTKAGSVIEYQLAKSGTSVSANYRSACRSRTDADFASRITICEEEADECCYWLEIIAQSGMLKKDEVKELWKEANELTAIFAASAITIRNKINNSKGSTNNQKSRIINQKSK
jgi:four helix bundle protein